MKLGLLIGLTALGIAGCGARSELGIGGVPSVGGTGAGGSASSPTLPPACPRQTPGTLAWSTIVEPSFCSSAHAVVRSDPKGEVRVEVTQAEDWLAPYGDTLPPGLFVDLAKLDAQGKERWSISVGRVPFSGIGHRALATDSSGGARVLTPQPIETTGQPVLSSVSDVGGRTQTALTRNPDGSWWPVALEIDRDLDTVLLGVANNGIDLGGGLLTVQQGEFFVAKLDQTNIHRWSRVFGGPVTQVDLDVEAAGSMTLAGLLRGDVTFGDMSFSSDGVGLFVASLEPDGRAIFSHLLRSANTPLLLGVGRDAQRNSYVAVGFNENLDLGEEVVAASEPSSLLIKYDTAGALLWTKLFGHVSALSFALSAAGEPLIAANVPRGFGLGDGVASGEASMLVAKLDPNGGVIWSSRLPGASSFAPSVAAGVCRSVLVAGVFQGVFDTGGQRLSSQRGSSCACAKWGSGTPEPCGAALVMSFADGD